MDKKKIKDIIPFVKRAKKTFTRCQIILFGSYAYGKPHKDSDFDILIISTSFQGVDLEERISWAFNLKRDLPIAMDIICLTPREMKEDHRLDMIGEVLRRGVDITSIA